MNRIEFIVANLLIGCFIIVAVWLTFGIFSNERFSSIFLSKLRGSVKQEGFSVVAKEELSILDGHCSKREKINIVSENDPHLEKLIEYQEVCQSFVTDTVMFFSAFPYSRASAQEEALEMANKLKRFHKNGIHPIVIIEPYAGSEPVDYYDFLAGGYNIPLDNYFQSLRDYGVTDDMMGTWVPFPESNTPNWENKNTEPKDFALCVNKYLGVIRKHYPNIKGSILLNAATYDPNDLEWNNGDYLSFNPYLEDIDKEKISSFGIQGFPWVSNATVDKKRQIFRPSEFLQPDLAIASAQELRTKDIWINTGVFATKYASDETMAVGTSLNDRKAMLSGILDVAKGIRDYQLNGYRVSVNLFAEDKSNFPEATDWSFFQNEDSKTLLKEFLRKAEELDIHISLFDIMHRSNGSE